MFGGTCAVRRRVCICASQAYAEAMYQAWVEDPTSVHSSWADAFSKNNPGDVISMTAALAVEGGVGGVSTESILDHLALQVRQIMNDHVPPPPLFGKIRVANIVI